VDDEIEFEFIVFSHVTLCVDGDDIGTFYLINPGGG